MIIFRIGGLWRPTMVIVGGHLEYVLFALHAVLFLVSSLSVFGFLRFLDRPVGSLRGSILRYSVLFSRIRFYFRVAWKATNAAVFTKRDNQLMVFSLSLAMVAGSNLDPDGRFCYVCKLRWFRDSGFWLIFLIRALLVFCSRTLITLGLRFSLQLLTIRILTGQRLFS